MVATEPVLANRQGAAAQRFTGRGAPAGRGRPKPGDGCQRSKHSPACPRTPRPAPGRGGAEAPKRACWCACRGRREPKSLRVDEEHSGVKGAVGRRNEAAASRCNALLHRYRTACSQSCSQFKLRNWPQAVHATAAGRFLQDAWLQPGCRGLGTPRACCTSSPACMWPAARCAAAQVSSALAGRGAAAGKGTKERDYLAGFGCVQAIDRNRKAKEEGLGVSQQSRRLRCLWLRCL